MTLQFIKYMYSFCDENFSLYISTMALYITSSKNKQNQPMKANDVSELYTNVLIGKSRAWSSRSAGLVFVLFHDSWVG